MTEQQSPPPAPEPTPEPSQPTSGFAAQPAAQPVPGVAGFVYADVPNRAVAYIIDAIILFIISIVIGAIVGTFLPSASFNPFATNLGNVIQINYAAILVVALLGLVANGIYFVYSWTRMRGSPGQKMLGMQVGTAADGSTLTQDQAIRRWIFLGAPFSLATALNPIPAIGLLIGLAGFAYVIYLLITTAQSPTKQGFHDKQVNSVVVKSARTVG